MYTQGTSIAQEPGSKGTALVTGEGSVWEMGHANIGGKTFPSGEPGGEGILNVDNHGSVKVKYQMNVFPEGTVIVKGGAASVLIGPEVFALRNVERSVVHVTRNLSSSGQLRMLGGRFSAEEFVIDGELSGLGDIGGNVVNRGTVAPGNSSGVLTIDGNYAQTSAGKLFIELGGTTPGTAHDQVLVTGQLALHGTLNVSLINGFAPQAGNSFDILDWASLSGTFDALTLPALGAGLMWNASKLYTLGKLNVAITGDYNLDGIVDAADYVVWRKGLGTTYTQDDFNTWRANFGTTLGSGSSLTATQPSSPAVPEPASALLAIYWAAAGARRVRRFVCQLPSTR
jgi:T5SS/PEP-CTERM-associated repeat protein